MKNITSRADVFPFPKSFLDHLNRRTKIELRCRYFVNFFFAVMRCSLFLFCGVAMLTVPQCPPLFSLEGDPLLQEMRVCGGQLLYRPKKIEYDFKVTFQNDFFR